MPLPQTVKLALAAFATALLSACGGGDGGASSEGGYTVESGVAQKGPLSQGSAILINELAATSYQPNGKEYTFFTNNNLGTFTPSGITYSTPYLSTYASGYYFNELTGAQSNDTVGLRGLSQIGTVGNAPADTVINVNALSSMAVNRITRLATTAPVQAFALARAQAQKEALGSFFIYNGTSILTGTTVNSVAQPGNLTALDLSKNRAGDQILAALSAVVMTAGTNGSGVNLLLSQIANDLADDGLLNNSTQYRTSVQSRLCAAAASTDFAAVATNLNSFYGTNYQATDLSQWVDTSGCVDQVINKYKFSASNIAVGTVSQSPAYVAGPDDVGQCFSVGGVTSGATAGLYYKGGSSAIVGTQRVVLGDSMTIGLNASAAGAFSGFIQRSAPAANGTCPSQVPVTGLTRVQKYTISASPVQACTNLLDGLTGISLGSNTSLYDNQGFLNNGLDATAFRSNIAFANTQTPFKIATPIFSGMDGFGNYVFSVTLVNIASGAYISDLSVPMTVVGSSCVITGNHLPFELSIQPTIKSTLRVDGVTSVNTTPSPVAGIEIQFGSQGMPLAYAGQTVNSARVEMCDASNNCSLVALLTNPGGSSNYMQLSASNYPGVNYSFLNLIPNPSFSLVNSLANPIKVSFFSSQTAPTTGTANLIGSPIMTRSTADKFSSAEIASISGAMPTVPYTGTAWLASFSNPIFNFNPGSTVISSIQLQRVVSGNTPPQSMSKLVLSGTPGSVSFPGVVAANTDFYHALYLAGHVPGRNGMIETKYVWAPSCSSCY